MVLPQPYDPIGLGLIRTEFGGADPSSMSEYYRGGSYVTENSPNNPNIPTSGEISLSDFYGAFKAILVNFEVTRDADNTNYFYLNASGLPTISITIGGNYVETQSYYISPNTIYTVTANVNDIILEDGTMKLEDYDDGDYNDLTVTPLSGSFYQDNGFFYILSIY